MSQPKVIAFDVFGTVVDMSNAHRTDIVNYLKHINLDPWQPLQLPTSWESFSAHPDSVDGINQLRKHYLVATCSNGPLGLLSRLSKNAGLNWDVIIPLELNRVYKPNTRAYLTVCEVLGVRPIEVMMVTANETFGDLEAARMLGMIPVLIRSARGGPQTIVELAELLRNNAFERIVWPDSLQPSLAAKHDELP